MEDMMGVRRGECVYKLPFLLGEVFFYIFYTL
jgi:hypothetical protein